MKTPNEHITEYLDHYFKEVVNPGYAVMLTGDWGCGKTWFIKDFIKNHPQMNVLYVSLYGLSSTDEIDDILFTKLHPILGSKTLSTAGQILKGMIRVALKVDLDDIQTDNLNAEILTPEIDIKELASKVKNHHIIFDDFERSKIPIETLMGYVNSFVEHKGLNVVLVGNEEEINSNKDERFAAYKEKVVGQSYNIIPVVNNTLPSFIDEIKNNQCKGVLENYSKKIGDIFEAVGYKNLRDLRQALLSFEYLYKKIDSKYYSETEFISKLVEIFLYLSLELKANMITKDNWKDALGIFQHNKLSRKKFLELEQDRREQLLREDLLAYYIDTKELPLANEWEKIIFDGCFSEISINDSIAGAKYFLEKNKSLLAKLLSEWPSLSPEEFKTTFLEFWKELNNNAYKHPGDILHALDMLLIFHKYGLIEKSLHEITTEIKRMIIELFDVDQMTSFDFSRWGIEEYGGYGYSNRETTEFQEIYSLLKERLGIKEKHTLENKIKELVDNLPESYAEFCKYLLSPLNGGEYENSPILAWIDLNKFLDGYIKISSHERYHFIYILKDRYEMRFSNGRIREPLVHELNFLLCFSNLIKSKIDSEGMLYRTDNYILKEINEELKKIITYFRDNIQKTSN